MMKSERKRKTIYVILKVLGVAISCFFPIWAILERFPLWKEHYGEGRSLSVGMILVLFVVAIIFRKAVFKYITDKFNLHHAPPIFIWLVLLIVAYILIFIGNFMRDLTTVLWMGALGCAIGTVITYIGENFFGNKENKDDGTGI